MIFSHGRVVLVPTIRNLKGNNQVCENGMFAKCYLNNLIFIGIIFSIQDAMLFINVSRHREILLALERSRARNHFDFDVAIDNPELAGFAL